MKATENRPRHDPHVPGEIMADDQRGWQPGRWLWQAGTQPAVGPRPAVVNLPDAKRLLQMLLPERNQETEALPA